MNDVDVLKDVIQRLNRGNIDYMLSGSVSMSFYTTPRMTRDIDIVIYLSISDTGTMYELFKDSYYIDEDMIKNAVIHHDMFNIIHNSSIFKVDFIVRKDEDFRVQEFNNKKTINFDGIEMKIVSLEDLIISKIYRMRETGSEIQKRDIVSLLSKNPDISYIEYWCKQLGILEVYRGIAV